MSQDKELRQLVKDHDDPGRPGLIPSLPDFMGFLLTFFVCWGIYTLVVKGFAVLEDKKQEVRQSAAAQQKKVQALKQVSAEVSQTVEETRDEIGNRNPKLGKAFDWLADVVRDGFSSDQRQPSENRF